MEREDEMGNIKLGHEEFEIVMQVTLRICLVNATVVRTPPAFL